MSTFTLAISRLTTSNLPWFMDLTFQVPMQYCSLRHQTLLLSPVPSTNGCCFCFGSIPSFFSGVISPLISSSILGTYWPGKFLFQYPIIFAFSYCSWGSQGKNTEVVCHSLLQWTTFCQTSPPWPCHLGLPHMAWLSFTELDKTMVLWSSWLVFCDCGFSVSALWCPLAAPTVLLGVLLPWTWGISSLLLQQSAAAAPYLGRGVPSHGRPSWPWTWSSSSWPSCARAAAAPWRWSSSSRAGALTS